MTARLLLLSAATLLMGVGIWLGEATQTMMNAIMLCLACMGVG